jgi:hypothetical protein
MEGRMNTDKKKQTVPEDLVQEMVETLELECDADWTEEFGASGGKTTLPAVD